MGRIRVRIAEEAGFCFGVLRAIELARQQRAMGRPVYLYGNLVHNQRVIKLLEEEGILSDLPDGSLSGSVILRAHGVTSTEKDALSARSEHIIDATCPMVQTIKQKMDHALSQGGRVLLFGKAEHPEAQGLKDNRDEIEIVQYPSDINALKTWITESASISLFSQSTMMLSDFDEITRKLVEIRPDAVIRNTICDSSRKRQQALIELAKQVPLVLVVGDETSSNCNSLVDLASQITQVQRVSCLAEIDVGWFEDLSEIGLTGSASTPPELIREVAEAIEAIE